jgi:hypothetical protein
VYKKQWQLPDLVAAAKKLKNYLGANHEKK